MEISSLRKQYLTRVLTLLILQSIITFSLSAQTPILGSMANGILTNRYSLTDIGENSNTTLGDLDGDGDLDLISGDLLGNFHYFENIGSSATPLFGTAQLNPFSLSDIGDYSSPVFADLDGDGDLDLISGDELGDFYYFPNNGTTSSPMFGAVQLNPFSLTDIGDYSSPELADMDGDGDLDLISGAKSGSFYYFENNGTVGVANFNIAVDINPFSLADIGLYSAPSLKDLNNDGLLDLISGAKNGFFYYFNNSGTVTVPNFDFRQINPFGLFDVGSYSTPTFVDLDDDGDLDLMCGESLGKFKYSENVALPIYTNWDGDTDSDWNNASNWEDGIVPTSTANVVILNTANDPVISSGSDIELEILEIKTSARVYVNANSSLTVNANLKLSGGMIVESGASLLPLSTISASGATIYRKTTFGTFDGKYSIIGSPITNGNTTSLGDIIYSYDENIAYEPGIGNSNGSNRFLPVLSPESMSSGDAYFSANTGDIAFNGIPNHGNIDVPLVYNASDGDGAGFNLISNPYTAAISYNDLMAANPNIDGTIYLWDDGGSNVSSRGNSDYITANSMGAANGGSGRNISWDGYIRSIQGFFVKATFTDTLHFTPSMMSTGNNSDGGFFRTESPTVLKFALSSNTAYNEILLGFSDKATMDIDRTMDAFKVKGNSVLQLYSKMNKTILAIQALPILTEETTVELGFDIDKGGIYTFEFKDASIYEFTVFLRDNKFNRLIDLSNDHTYTFETPSVFNSERFSLVFTPYKVLQFENPLVSNQLIVFPNALGLNVRMNVKIQDATISIYNLSGTLLKRIKHVAFNGEDWTTSFNKQGLFIMTVQGEGELFVKKFVKN